MAAQADRLETSQAATPLSLEVAATATLDSDGLAVANDTSAEAETLDAAPPVTVAAASMPESVDGFNLSQDIPDASQIARACAQERAKAQELAYPWGGGARAESSILEQTPSGSRSRSRSRGETSPSQLSQALSQTRMCHVVAAPKLLACSLRLESRTYTLRGSQLALAMLRGMKAFENRDFKLRPGWYAVHAGNGSIGDDHAAILACTWPTAPDAESLPRGAIFGMVLHGQPLEPASVPDPWALGRWCHPVLASIEFSTPVLGVKGRLGVWYLDNIAQASLGQALLSSTFRDFDAPEAEAARQCVPSLTVADQATAAQKTTWDELTDDAKSEAERLQIPRSCSLSAQRIDQFSQI
jgi:hypothetical protein